MRVPACVWSIGFTVACGSGGSGAPASGGTSAASGSGGSGAQPSGGTGPASGNGGGVSAGAPTGGSNSAGASGAGGAAGGSVGARPCQGLECRQTTCTLGDCAAEPCSAGALTTLSGVVYDPAGALPLHDVMVFVPNGPIPPIAHGASCDRCGLTTESPVASSFTDTQGRFVLEDVPVGANVPLVIQVGKWRRAVTVPDVPACVNTTLDAGQTRLPRDKTEGDLPWIALTTGGGDALECMLRRMGLADTEFTTADGDGSVHLFAGGDSGTSASTKQFAAELGGATLSPATDLWETLDALARYDAIVLSCEGDALEDEKPQAARQALYDYLGMGGRVLASHWQHYWFSEGPNPLPDIGTWNDSEDPLSPALGSVDTSFPEGAAFADWLVHVGASLVPGQIEIQDPRNNIQAVNAELATSWITLDEPAVELLTFEAPLEVAADQRCGRAVYTALHAASTGLDVSGEPFPSGCEVRGLSPEEKAIAFMLFDLAGCR